MHTSRLTYFHARPRPEGAPADAHLRPRKGAASESSAPTYNYNKPTQYRSVDPPVVPDNMTRLSRIRLAQGRHSLVELFVDGDGRPLVPSPDNTLYYLQLCEGAKENSVNHTDKSYSALDSRDIVPQKFRTDLEGAEPAVKALWKLFTFLFQHLRIKIAQSVMEGTFIDARVQALGTLALVLELPSFRSMYKELEGTELVYYFSGKAFRQEWDFVLPNQGPLTFSALAHVPLVHLMLGELAIAGEEVTQDIIQTTRNASTDATVLHDTAGFRLAESSPLTPHAFNADTAERILNAIGAGKAPRDGLHPLREKLALYISPSVLSLAGLVAVQSGLEYVSLGSEPPPVPEKNEEPKPMLSCLSLAFAATFVEAEVKVVANLGSHNGKRITSSALKGVISEDEDGMLNLHRMNLTILQKDPPPELTKALRTLEAGLNLRNVKFE